MQTADRPTLLVGCCDREILNRMEDHIPPAGSGFMLFGNTNPAVEWLQNGEPLAVLVALPPQNAEPFILGIRGMRRLSRVPIVMLSDEMTDLTFVQVLAWGGDDLVLANDFDGIGRRLRAIPGDMPLGPQSDRGVAVLAHADQKQRVLLARVLRNSGFNVRFAINAAEVESVVTDPTITLVVVDWNLDATGLVKVLRNVRGEHNTVPWILSAPPSELVAASLATEGLERVTVHDSYAPAENLLFVANESLSGSFAEQRASARLLFGTLVAFREAGRDHDRHGYTYNISADGLFVRTLDPLIQNDEVWLELTPPRTDRRVRLEGTVRWRRPVGPSTAATVPPGFGVHLAGGLAGDLGRFREGYHAFARDIAGIRRSSRPSR